MTAVIAGSPGARMTDSSVVATILSGARFDCTLDVAHAPATKVASAKIVNRLVIFLPAWLELSTARKKETRLLRRSAAPVRSPAPPPDTCAIDRRDRTEIPVSDRLPAPRQTISCGSLL